MVDLNKKPATFVTLEGVSNGVRKSLGLGSSAAGKPGTYAAVKPAGVVPPPTYTHMGKPSCPENTYVPPQAFYRNDGLQHVKSKGSSC